MSKSYYWTSWMILHFIFWGSEGLIQKERRDINSEKGAQISIVDYDYWAQTWQLFLKNFHVKYFVHIYVGGTSYLYNF